MDNAESSGSPRGCYWGYRRPFSEQGAWEVHMTLWKKFVSDLPGSVEPPPSSSWYRGITVQVPSVGLKVYEGNCSWPRWRGVRTKAGFFLQGGGPSEGSGHRWRGLFLDWFPQLLALFRAFSRRKYSPLSWILQLALRCIHLRRASHVLKHHSSS